MENNINLGPEENENNKLDENVDLGTPAPESTNLNENVDLGANANLNEAVDLGTPANNGYSAPNNYGYGQQGYTSPAANSITEQESGKKGTMSLIFGLLSLLCCNPLCIFSILSIVYALQSKKLSTFGKFPGTALAGLICGILGIGAFVLSGIYSILAIIAALAEAGAAMAM